VRTIVSQVLGTDSITFRFDDGSVVWVCFRPATVVDANARVIARMVAQQFLNNLEPTPRWGRRRLIGQEMPRVSHQTVDTRIAYRNGFRLSLLLLWLFLCGGLCSCYAACSASGPTVSLECESPAASVLDWISDTK
jgi:hypothetical protein